MLSVGTPSRTLRVPSSSKRERDAERPNVDPHAERGNQERVTGIKQDQTRDSRGGGSGGVEGTMSACIEGRQTRAGGTSSGDQAAKAQTGRTAPALIHRFE